MHIFICVCICFYIFLQVPVSVLSRENWMNASLMKKWEINKYQLPCLLPLQGCQHLNSLFRPFMVLIFMRWCFQQFLNPIIVSASSMLALKNLIVTCALFMLNICYVWVTSIYFRQLLWDQGIAHACEVTSLPCKPLHNCVRFEVFMAVTMKNGVFWVVTPCGSCKNRRFGGTWRLHQRTSVASCCLCCS
jgi:hypothetical protein